MKATKLFRMFASVSAFGALLWGCGSQAEIDQAAEPLAIASTNQGETLSTPPSDSLSTNTVQSETESHNGQCCVGICYKFFTYYKIGNKDVKYGHCENWIRRKCDTLNASFVSASWSSCNRTDIDWY